LGNDSNRAGRSNRARDRRQPRVPVGRLVRSPAGGGPQCGSADRRRKASEVSTDRTIEVIVEIPRGSRNKYEYDHERHVMRLDRRLFSATFYPADYGFVPDTLAEDGDPLDVLVLLDEPTFPGCLVECRPVGVFWMTDEKGPDAKIISVACGDPMWESVRDLDGLPPHLTFEIAHFFDVYKDLEPDKLTKVGGFDGVDAAWAEIDRSFERAKTSS